jgi:hypothetical protein
MTCKDAYLRENGGARLAAVLAVAVLMLLLLASAMPAERRATISAPLARVLPLIDMAREWGRLADEQDRATDLRNKE